MKQYRFEEHYQQEWNYFENQLNCLEKKRSRKKEESVELHNFPQNYQNICEHLALAEERGYTVFLIHRLQQLVQRGHQILYQRRTHFLDNIVNFILRDFPNSVREEKNLIIATHLIFYLGAFACAMIGYFYPEFKTLIVSQNDLYSFEEMYSGDVTTSEISLRDADQNWYMFAFYIYNNISIAFRMFASGLIFCLGSLFYLFYNALYFGIIALHVSDSGLGDNFWPFVIGHSAFELTAILIAAAAGFKIGLAVLIPHRKTRVEALRDAAKPAIKLMFGVFFFLIIAAFIEAYWSSMNETSGIRYIVGLSLWIGVLSYFIYMGRDKPQ